MAGRGTDIRLGGDADGMHEQVVALGGLYVIGTNRHESLRIDNQLRGRAGRQGDPGSSRFFISLGDDLIQRYGVMALIPKAHRPALRSSPINDPIVSREIARAQRIVEGQNFEIRRTLWKYSAMVDDQRAVVYRWRQELLQGESDPGVWVARAPERSRDAPGACRGNGRRRARGNAVSRHHRPGRPRASGRRAPGQGRARLCAICCDQALLEAVRRFELVSRR